MKTTIFTLCLMLFAAFACGGRACFLITKPALIKMFRLPTEDELSTNLMGKDKKEVMHLVVGRFSIRPVDGRHHLKINGLIMFTMI